MCCVWTCNEIEGLYNKTIITIVPSYTGKHICCRWHCYRTVSIVRFLYELRTRVCFDCRLLHFQSSYKFLEFGIWNHCQASTQPHKVRLLNGVMWVHNQDFKYSIAYPHNSQLHFVTGEYLQYVCCTVIIQHCPFMCVCVHTHTEIQNIRLNYWAFQKFSKPHDVVYYSSTFSKFAPPSLLYKQLSEPNTCGF